jgi:dTDP-4-dehydrorhamnose reductase
MRRVLVTGGNGQLGEAIRRAAEGSANHYTFATIDELDICNGADVERYITENKVDTIINCAAYTDVEGAEDNANLAYAINSTAVAHMAEVCKRLNVRLIHISTDYVFGGDSERRTPYTESDATAPLNIYGRSKAEGEVAVIEHDGIVIRTSWLYAPWGKNFVLTMLRLGRERDEISVVNDQRGTPTSALGLARAIVLMVDTAAIESMRGIYHYTDDGECTWHDFACEIMRQAGLACRVEPCTTAERNMRAERPAYSVLNTERIAAIKGIDIAPWQERLREAISLIKK